jgi:hypothetical protein
MGPLRRRDVYKLRRERVRRDFDRHGGRSKKQCAFNVIQRVHPDPTRLYIARLPQAKFDEETGRTTCSRKTRTPLPLNRAPVSMSFGVFNSYVFL